MEIEPLELTILMPCLNEEVTLGSCINKANTFLKNSGTRGEVLISDNGSTDGSVELARSLGARVVHAPEKGYGNALLYGIKEARGRYIIMGDSDDSYDFLNLQPFMDKLREGHDLVMGNRFAGGIQEGAMPFLHRYLGNPVLSFIGRLFFKIRIRDFHCGLRGFNREKILGIHLNTTGMEFASEMVVKSALNGLSITQVPTTLSKDGRDRKPHLNTWRDGWRHLRFLLIFSPKWLFFFPGLFFLILGLALSILLIIKPIQIARVNLDIHTLLYAGALLFIGLQFIFFYVFSKVYGGNQGFLPQNKTYYFLIRWFSLEKGIVAGSLLILTGVILTILGFREWYSVHFGDLVPRSMLRLLIPAVISLISGIQIIQNSFFISTLSIKTKGD